MRYPVRAEPHVKERKAIRILEEYLPEEWIVREFTEHDYGVDLYVEIVGKDRQVTGKLVALQVKGTEEMNFNKKNQYRHGGIKMSTFRYWRGLPVVVFLVVVDLKNKIPYWANVRAAARDFADDGKRRKVSFLIDRQCSFDQVGLILFQLHYMRERKWPDIAKAVLDSLMLFNSLGPLYLYCSRKKPSAASSATVQFLVLRHYENFCLMSRYLDGKTPIDLPEWYDKHLAYIVDNGLAASITFYYATIMELFESFIHDYWRLIEAIYQMATVHQKDYWMRLSPYLVGQFNMKPLKFIADDWFTRYYFDEYENETHDPAGHFFEDLDLSFYD